MMDVKCAQKHYASKYRVDMIAKALRKVQAYCDGQLHACHECVFGDAAADTASVGRECNQS